MPIDVWQRFLTRNGFSGLDIKVRDCEDDTNYAMSVIMSTAVEETLPDYPTDVTIVYASSACPDYWINDLKASIQAITLWEPSIQSLDSVQAEGKVCIVVGEIDEAILHGMDSQRFAKVSNMLNQAKGVLWVSRGATMTCERPEASLHSGLLRTLRLENSMKRYISLDIDPKRPSWTPAAVTAISDVFKAAFNEAQDMSSIDFEFAERDKLIYIARLNDDIAETNATVPSTGPIEPEEQPFWGPDRELRLEAMTPGMLDSLIFKDDPSSGESLPDDFVEIKPLAFGLNFRDIMVAMGQLQEKIMGFECGGIVTRLGPNATHEFKVGDRVCALTTRGHWASFIRIPWTGIARIPDDMSFEVAASIPMVFVTAYYSLIETGRLEKGETVLIHAASGGVGQAAIILAKHIGAQIYVTVGTSEKREFIKTTYGVADDHIFSSRDPSFAADIMAATKGRGVDVVLNSLSGLLLHESWNCVAKLGRFIEIGKRDIQLNKHLDMEPLGRAISFSAVDLIHLGNEKGRVMSRVMSKVLHLLAQKAIETVKPITVFPISELQRAFRTMQAGKHLGKIIITPNEGDVVKVSQSLSCYLLRSRSYDR